MFLLMSGLLDRHLMDTFTDPRAIFEAFVILVLMGLASVLIRDFCETFLYRPKHFLPAKRFPFLDRDYLDLPLLDGSLDDDYRAILAHGSKLVILKRSSLYSQD